MDLSLTEAERAQLAALNVTAALDGTLRGRGGRVVEPGAAVALLAKTAVLTDSRGATSSGATGPAGPPLGPLPGGGPAVSPRVARTGPAGPGGPAGSGTADRDLDGGEGWGETGDQVDPDWGDGDLGLLKGLVPSYFHRPYLSAGHQANSPAVTGHQTVIPAPQMDVMPGNPAHVAEPADFRRGSLEAGHADPSPADMDQVNPTYAAGADAYELNRQRERSEHLMPSTCITSSPPSHGHMQMPSDMRAAEVPVHIAAAATNPAPGEAR